MVDRALARRPKPRPDRLARDGLSRTGYSRSTPNSRRKRSTSKAKKLDPESIGSDWRKKGASSDALFRWMLDRTRTPMMVGLTTYDFKPTRRPVAVQLGRPPPARRRAAKLPQESPRPVRRVRPADGRLAVADPPDAVPIATSSSGLSFGESPGWFDLGPYRLGAAICFEDTDAARHPPPLLRGPRRGAARRARQPVQRRLVPRPRPSTRCTWPSPAFRCVENRVPMVRAVNTGVSAVIDGNGAIVRELPKDQGQDVLDGGRPARRPDLALLPVGRLAWPGHARRDARLPRPRPDRPEEQPTARARPGGSPIGRLKFSRSAKLPCLSIARVWCRFRASSSRADPEPVPVGRRRSPCGDRLAASRRPTLS